MERESVFMDANIFIDNLLRDWVIFELFHDFINIIPGKAVPEFAGN